MTYLPSSLAHIVPKSSSHLTTSKRKAYSVPTQQRRRTKACMPIRRDSSASAARWDLEEALNDLEGYLWQVIQVEERDRRS
jgi:hypothetical protein